MSAVRYRTGTKTYFGATAIEVVLALERDTPEYADYGAPLCDFLSWSLARLADRIPSRDLQLSPRVSDETLALWYLSLCDEYGLGTLSVLPYETEAS